MYFLLGLAVGVLLSIIFAKYFLKPKIIGTLRVDQSDPDGPYLFLELNASIEKIIHQKKVVMNVNVKNYISQD